MYLESRHSEVMVRTFSIKNRPLICPITINNKITLFPLAALAISTSWSPESRFWILMSFSVKKKGDIFINNTIKLSSKKTFERVEVLVYQGGLIQVLSFQAYQSLAWKSLGWVSAKGFLARLRYVFKFSKNLREFILPKACATCSASMSKSLGSTLNWTCWSSKLKIKIFCYVWLTERHFLNS